MIDVDDVLTRFTEDRELRETGPLMISELFKRIEHSTDEETRRIKELLILITKYSRHHETWTFLIESYYDQQSSKYLGLFIELFASVLYAAKSGPISKKKTKFLSQLSGILLNSFFKEEEIIKEGIESYFNLLKVIADIRNFSEEFNINDMAMIVWKDTVGLLILRFIRILAKQEISTKNIIEELFDGTYYHAEYTNMILGRAKSLRDTDDTIDHQELSDTDICWWLNQMFLYNKFPGCLNGDMKYSLAMKCCTLHANKNEYKAACCMFKEVNKLGVLVDYSSYDIQMRSLSRRMIEIACTAPPIDGPMADKYQGLSQSMRTEIFECYKGIYADMEISKFLEISYDNILQSKNDSAISAFVTACKIKWVNQRDSSFNESSKFYVKKIIGNILYAEFPVIDGIDSLFACINWMRFIQLDDPLDFSKALDVISLKLDVSLKENRNSTDIINRLNMLAHVIARVKQISP
jgi:hypothetical protein